MAQSYQNIYKSQMHKKPQNIIFTFPHLFTKLIRFSQKQNPISYHFYFYFLGLFTECPLLYKFQKINKGIDMTSIKKKVLIEEVQEKAEEDQTEQIMKEEEIIQESELFKGGKRHIKADLSSRLSKCIVCRKMCQYRCPSCAKNYCSIEHFRSHNLFCSQKFFQKQVTESLKKLKVTDKNEKKKAVEMVRDNAQKMQDLFMYGAELTEERLEELLKEIQEGKQPKLSPKEQIIFQKYLSHSLKEEDETINQQTDRLEVEAPYWEIQDGLSIYLQTSPQIEEYNESEHPNIIAYRDLARKRLQQFLAVHHQPQEEQASKTLRPEILSHIFQILHAYVSLYRVHDGESVVFMPRFIKSYVSSENQQLLKMQKVKVESLLNITQTTLFADMDSDEQKTYQLWLTEYYPIILQDLTKIFSNKHLVIQTFLRIIDNVSLFEEDNKSEASKLANRLEEGSRKLSKIQKMGRKVSKKCQFLLLACLKNYDNANWKQELFTFCQKMAQNHQKDQKQKQLFQQIRKIQEGGLILPQR